MLVSADSEAESMSTFGWVRLKSIVITFTPESDTRLRSIIETSAWALSWSPFVSTGTVSQTPRVWCPSASTATIALASRRLAAWSLSADPSTSKSTVFSP